jgi:hypothetical protein
MPTQFETLYRNRKKAQFPVIDKGKEPETVLKKPTTTEFDKLFKERKVKVAPLEPLKISAPKPAEITQPKEEKVTEFDKLFKARKPERQPKGASGTFQRPYTHTTKPSEMGIERPSEIKEVPSVFKRIGTQIKRKSMLAAKGLVGDIPFVRKIIPEEGIWERTQPTESTVEKVISGLTPVVRDIGLYSMGAGFADKLSKVPKIARIGEAVKTVVPRLLRLKKGVQAERYGNLAVKMIKEGFKGGFLGITTADTEKSEGILKKGAEMATTFAAFPAVMKGIGTGGRELGKLTPEPIKKKMIELGKSVGMVLRNNKVTELVRKRYGEIQSGAIDSEVFIRRIEKTLTPKERSLIPFLRERALTKEAKALLKTPEIRKRYFSTIKPMAKQIGDYLDDSHKMLVEHYGNDVGFVEKFIPHIWDIPKNKEKEVINWFVTRNPHLKKRRIETLKEGIEKFGLKPKSLDVAKVLRTYDQFKFKAIANIKFAKSLLKLEDSAGVKLIQRADKAPPTWKTIDHPVLRKAVYIAGGGKKEIKKMIKPPPITSAKVPLVLDEGLVNVFKTKTKLPPIKKGYIRLYRAEGGALKHKDIWKSSDFPLPKNFIKGDSKFYTKDLKYADSFRYDYGKGAYINYIDVPPNIIKNTKLPYESIVDTSVLKKFKPKVICFKKI